MGALFRNQFNLESQEEKLSLLVLRTGLLVGVVYFCFCAFVVVFFLLLVQLLTLSNDYPSGNLIMV